MYDEYYIRCCCCCCWCDVARVVDSCVIVFSRITVYMVKLCMFGLNTVIKFSEVHHESI